MPYIADVDTTAGAVKPGDTYTLVSPSGGSSRELVIASVKSGTKWTEARDAEGSLIFRKENDAQIWLHREVPTEEEIAAKEAASKQAALDFKREMLNTMHAKMHEAVHTAKQAMRGQLDKEGFVNPDMMDDLIVAQEHKVIACHIDAILEHNPEMTIEIAMGHAADNIKENLVAGYDEPTQSGGFTFNNAARQTRIVARRKFIQGIAWGIL